MTHSLPRYGLMCLAGAAVAGLFWLGATVHLRRACVLQDTPYLPLCGNVGGQTDAERVRELRTRIAADPGDSIAWTQLTALETGANEPALFRAASVLAPADPNVLMWRAGHALTNNDLPQATELLVALVEFRGKGEASETLARLVASGQGTALLRPHLRSAARWLPPVLAALSALKLPVGAALPLLAEASAKNAVGKQTVQAYIRDLKRAGEWSDAYGLWIAQQKQPTGLLHNGRFDQPFEPDGFDWEVTSVPPSRTGAVITQRGSGNRGQVLDIQFNGKALVVPLLRQYIFMPPGKYLLRGQFMSSRLRTEQGLAWTMRCSNDKAATGLAGRSEALTDTLGTWKTFQFAIAAPSDCGQVISLQLETVSPLEAASGLKGRIAFDNFELVPERL